jgi:hypothetical protein
MRANLMLRELGMRKLDGVHGFEKLCSEISELAVISACAKQLILHDIILAVNTLESFPVLMCSCNVARAAFNIAAWIE